MSEAEPKGWLVQQIRGNPSFVQGWNSALWEVRKAQLDGLTTDGEFLRDLVHSVPQDKPDER